MNTETGRIYPPDEVSERLKAVECQEREAFDAHQADFERALNAGKIAAAATLTGQQAARIFSDLGVLDCEPTEHGALWRFNGGIVLVFDGQADSRAAWFLGVES